MLWRHVYSTVNAFFSQSRVGESILRMLLFRWSAQQTGERPVCFQRNNDYRKSFFLKLKIFFMGLFEKGILGGFLGKIGTVIGSKWRGVDYMRSKPPSSRKNSSPAQLEQQAKFAVAIILTRNMASLFRITYKNYAKKMTQRNNALSHILKNCMIGAYPDYDIDYEKVLVSRGGLENALLPKAVSGPGSIKFTWIVNDGMNGAQKNDQSIVVAYCPERKQCIYKLYAGTREQGNATLDVPAFTNKEVVTWLAFISEDGLTISDSVFTGRFMIEER